MENNRRDPNRTDTQANQRPNDDANRKQPEQKGSADKKAEMDPEVPNVDFKKNENPNDVRMNRDTGKEKDERDTTEDADDNDMDDKGKKSDPDSQDKERSNKVTM